MLLTKGVSVNGLWIKGEHKVYTDEIPFSGGGRIMKTLSIIVSVKAKEIRGTRQGDG